MIGVVIIAAVGMVWERRRFFIRYKADGSTLGGVLPDHPQT